MSDALDLSVKAAASFIGEMIITFVGTEEEGRELSLAIVCVADGALGRLQLRPTVCGLQRPGMESFPCDPLLRTIENPGAGESEPIGPVVFRYVNGKPDLLESLRDNARRMSVRAPGGLDLPVAVIEEHISDNTVDYAYRGAATIRRPHLHDGRIDAAGAHKRYCEATGQCRLAEGGTVGCHADWVRYVAWFKPAEAIRIYAHGALRFHLMHARDGGGYIFRDLDSNIGQLRQAWTLAFGETAASAEVLWRLYEAMVFLGETRTGAAAYVVKDADTFERWLPGSSDAAPVPVSRHRAISGDLNITKATDVQLLHYLRQDGALVLDSEGRLLAFRVYFRSAGGRRATAANVTEKTGESVAAVVSQDGGIWVYQSRLPDGKSELGERAKPY